VTDEETTKIKDIYEKANYKVLLTSEKTSTGIEALKEELHGHTTVFAGPSGVGKSSLLNLIQSHVKLETGQISKKIQRGKHTTRHAELIPFEKDSYVVDTPGFSSLNIGEVEASELKYYYREFSDFANGCKFHMCNHINEPKCGVKDAVKQHAISESRYESYVKLYNELDSIRRY
jgi:ribosome biogenesis GTPase